MTQLRLLLWLLVCAPPLLTAVTERAHAQTWASAIQTESPPENAASPSLLDRAEFPSRLAIAIDQPLGDPDAGRAVTFRLTPLSLVALLGGPGDSDSSGRFGALRRVGMSATLGGATQADDDPREQKPRAVTNHFTAQVKLGVTGVPDRSERDTLGPPNTAPEAVSLSLTADTYATGFGRDLYAATVILESRRAVGLIANLGYRREERIHDPRREEIKVGAGIGCACFSSSRHRVDGALSCDELIRNLDRATIVEGNAKVDLLMSDHLRLTSAVTCANHDERYAEGPIRGSVGLGYAFQ